jgi:signal transduction histidine kinase/ligand-binding sensor domain-containing protein
MRRGRGGALSAVVLVLAASAAAEELTPVRAFRVFDRATAPELPESIVVDLFQDADGLLWIDSFGGLATYDGAALRAVRDPEAPRGPSVLAERRRGGLYALSRRGLHVFDGRWRRVDTPEPVRALAEEDGLWLWTVRGEEVWRTPAGAEGSRWERVALQGAPGPPRALASDRRGGVYVFARDGVVRCRAGACAPVPASGGRPGRATAALAARDGALWLGTTDGRLLVAREGAAEWQEVETGPWPSGGVRALAEDAAGRIWAGGMARLCHGGVEAGFSCWGAEHGLPRSAILSLLADREGTLWIGLNGAGLLQWVGQPWTHRTRWPGDDSGGGLDVIGLSATADGGVLASAFGRGILRWDRNGLAAWGAADGLREDVRVVIEPRAGVVWAGARDGIYEKHGSQPFRRTLPLLRGFASGFVRDPEGAFHAWTEADGIFIRRGAGWEHARELEALAQAPGARALFWTRQGELWLSTARELVRRDGEGRIERLALGLEHGLPDSVATLLDVGPDELWAGGQGGLAIRSAGRWRLLGEADGVPGNVYFLRRAPDGGVWLGGSRGIARFRHGRFTTWDRTNGLVADECNGGAVVLGDGTLLAATAGSLARFDPALRSAPPPPLRLAWRQPPEARGAALLPRSADERRITLAWSAPWLAPNPVEYSTRVGDGPWSAASRDTQLSVENLPAGASEIAVRARRVGLEPPEAWTPPLTLRLEVAPRLTETTAARLLIGLAAAAGLAVAAQLRARRAHARRLAALERQRADFMASASHELRTPVAQIRLFADMLRLDRVRSDAERRDALDTIHRATQRLEALAANLLEIARGRVAAPSGALEGVELTGLLGEVLHDLTPLAAARGATLVVDVAPGLRGSLDAEGLRRVLSNLVENALKYGPEGQTVRVGAGAAPGGLRLYVEDEGPGIPAAERERLFERFARLDRDRLSAVTGTGLGLAVVRETLARSGGDARIEDASPRGTRVVVSLPQSGSRP